jgi:hypothetical protein
MNATATDVRQRELCNYGIVSIGKTIKGAPIASLLCEESQKAASHREKFRVLGWTASFFRSSDS